jgi:integrase
MSSERQRDVVLGVQIGREQLASEIKQSAADALNDHSARSHSREDAVSGRQFERMVQATYEIDKDWKALEARFALFATGRLGMRGGEITHIHRDWVDLQDGVVEIPEHDPCDKGKREDEICGYCRRRALERVKANNLSIEDALQAISHVYSDAELARLNEDDLLEEAQELRREVNITMAEAREERWQPKTSEGAREIPFDFDVRAEMTIEEFFDSHEQWPKSKATLNRRIDEVADAAGIEDNVYPHALRATAASYHAAREVSAHSLMSIMGWADIGTARSYIRANSQQANREVRSKHR